MSPDPAAKATCLLVASARAGVMIRVLDSANVELGRGTGELRVQAPEGLYVVEWSSGAVTTETLVRLKADGETVVRYEPDPSGDAPARGPRPAMVEFVRSELRPSGRSRRSSIAVFVEADEGVSPADAQGQIRLISRSGRTVPATRKGLPDLPTSEGQAAFCYSVKSGRYDLQFRSSTGEILDQSIPAMEGRQTIVFLRATQVKLLVAEGEGFAQIRSAGVEPARTIIISVAGDEDRYRISERVRLAGVLMHDLATNGGSLSAEFEAVLDDPATDPLLRLYGALVILCRFEVGASPALDQEWPKSRADLKTFRKKWASRAIDWIGKPMAADWPIDWVTAMWQIARTMPEVRRNIVRAEHPRRIEVPPMFECSWRWAIAQSIVDPHAVPSSASLRAAARSAGATTPWLCWKAAAAKAAPSAMPRSVPSDVDLLVDDLVRKTGILLDTSSLNRHAADMLRGMDPEIVTTVMRAAQLAGEMIGKGEPALSQQLAVALALPVHQLRRRLARAVQDLDLALIDGDPAASSGSSDRDVRGEQHFDMPPASARRITHPDDPNKGRFGARASRGGFSLSASFAETSSREWTRIKLRVVGSAPDGTRLHFHLHDSFKPPEYKAKFNQGQAKLDVTAWGGFTVGVWIPDFQVELELDLAKVPAAPRNIRTR